jgi:rhamnogalacturonan endolyase
MLDVAYTANEGAVHFVLFTGLTGFYSYFINTGLGEQGEFRTLYRLAPDLFPNGRTYLKSEALPLFVDILNGVKVQVRTWTRSVSLYLVPTYQSELTSE